MATPQIDGIGPDYESVSSTIAITLRLSDTVLAAFNHAYATGEVEVAAKLRAVMKITESKRPKGDQRGGYDATVHADLWVGFVEATLTRYCVKRGRPRKRGSSPPRKK